MGRLCTYCRTTYYPPRHLRQQSPVVIRETIVKKQYIGVYAPEPYDSLQDAPAYEPQEDNNEITLYVVLGIAGRVEIGVVLLIIASI
jgi:hypothetical protein